MTIGEKIKELRHKNDVTQEKLAAYLSISSQSVSKWETETALPDIGMLIPLANFFHISVDELLCHSAETEDAEVEACIYEGNRLHQLGRYDAYLTFWRETAAKYPRNFQCMYQLASALWYHTAYTGRGCASPDEKNAYAREAIVLCERILEDCTVDSIRNGVLQTLVLLYSSRHLSCASEEKAVHYAEMASSCYVCRENLLASAYFTAESAESREKARRIRHTAILTFLDFATGYMTCYDEDRSIEEQISANEMALKVWQTVIADGNYLFYHSRIGNHHDGLARLYAKLGNRDEALHHIRLALEHAKAYDAIPEGEHAYTSLPTRAASCNKGEERSLTERALRDFRPDPCFDFLRDDPEFIALMEL